MNKKQALELHSGVIKKFRKRKILIGGIDEIWSCDLVIFWMYAKENNENKYLLNVIDAFSKF